MGINYNKKNITKDRQIFSRGPRDLQRKQRQEVSVDNKLQKQIELLNKQLKKAPLTGEQIDEEIIKAVKEETVKYREQINKLENEIIKLKDIINNKEILIEQLKKIPAGAVKIETESDRPKIIEVFIDPIEKDLKNIESHIETKETVGMSKEDVAGKVDKLKKLLGKE